MYQSHVIEIKRTFIGAAAAASDGFWYRAVHPRAEDLDGRHWPTLDDLRRATGHLFTTGRLSAMSLSELRRGTGSPFHAPTAMLFTRGARR
jgi:hypothetical protein